MSKVVVGMSVSLDGIAGGASEADWWPVHEKVLGWLFDLRSWRAAQGMEGGRDNADSELWAESYGRIGAQVMGRNMFDFGVEHWGENPPFHAPVFIVTHRERERVVKEGGTSYTFVTDGIESAVKQAVEAADGKDVLIAGGVSVAQQAIAAGLVDELELHVAPVLIGRGLRLLENLGGEFVPLESTRVVGSSGVVHLRYSVVR
ncbi:dihydrofolate reductase family protein [Planomonospora corallina]|uniref:Dihydrofolate reductase family protein n=1 Tax=Planomonospora corallina TaxID=1806052 RepID=A0ABV8I367_9ACTN